jgi:hypothetical protein
MTSGLFKKSVLVSFLSHLTLLSLFSLSFGPKMSPADYTDVFFLGQFLRSSQLKPSELAFKDVDLKKDGLQAVFRKNSAAMLLKERAGKAPYAFDYYLKPSLDLIDDNAKETFTLRMAPLPPPRPERKQTVTLHPMLPYSFPLYFKDRQMAHVELMFRIAPAGARNSILIKRKISSGNLEVDLLSIRYIGHYLFIQQNKFIPNDWQTAKIDLSARGE